MVSVRFVFVIASFREGLKLVNKLKHMFFFGLLLTASCAEKGIVDDNPQESFANVRIPYEDHNFEIAIKKLGEFKSRFPYSRFASEAELLIADCHFELGKFAEAGVEYEQFVKLHPKHPQLGFALFRIGMSYWKDAPNEIDREQEYTRLAIQKWQRLLKEYPDSSESREAKQLMEKGQRRIAEAQDFIARFYCRKEIWDSCVYESMNILENFPHEKDLAKEAIQRAAKGFAKLAKHYNPEHKDKNLFYRDSTKEDLEKKAREFKERAARL